MKALAAIFGDKDDIDRLVAAAGLSDKKMLIAAIPLTALDQMTAAKELRVGAQACAEAIWRKLQETPELLPTGR